MRVFLAVSINLIALFLLFLYQSSSLAAIFIGISLFGWFFYFLWKRQNLVEQRVKARVKEQQVIMPIEHVMFRAQESSGYSQTSGMGYMVLTDTELYFELVLLDLVVSVPLLKLTNAEYVYRLKGVSPGRKMLKISFVDDSGIPDSIAVNTKNMQQWKDAILSAINEAA